MNADIKHKTPKQIEKELHLVEKGESRSWGQLFLLLDSVDRTNYWIRAADSFTSWIEKNSACMHVKPAMAWRILASGRFVQQIASRVAKSGIDIPPLDKLPNAVSPENIELLSKLARAIPDDVFLELARRVFAGDVKRSELRSTWETFRPVLKGQTARGRGTPPPRLNLKDPDQYRSVQEAIVLETFKAAGPSWLGVDNPTLYKFFIHVNPQGYKIPFGSFLLTAVAILKPIGEDLQYHGICMPNYSKRIDSLYASRLSYCDYLWVFDLASFNQHAMSIDLDRIPPGIGVIKVANGNIQVLRTAEYIAGCGCNRIDLASVLLVRSLGGK